MALSSITLADITDFRYDGFRNQYSPKLIGYGGNDPETRLIPNTFPYQIKLFEGIQENIPSTTRVKLVSSGVTLTEVSKTQTPANMQYRVNYDELGTAVIEFNSAQKNLQVEISYYGLGHLIQKASLLAIQQAGWYEINVDYSQSPYTIPDDIIDTANRVMILADCSDGNVQVNLPDVALNKIEVAWKQTTKGGRLIVAAKSGDKIRGRKDYSFVYADSRGDSGHIYSDSNYWYIFNLNHTIKYHEDFFSNSDWSSREMGGHRIQYDNKSGSFILGETIREETSNYEHILMYDDGTYLYVRNSEGIATNNREITGLSSGATCDVNEGTGSSKNRDTRIYHGTGRNMDMIRVYFNYSSNNAYTPSACNFDLGSNLARADGEGQNIQQIDSDNGVLITALAIQVMLSNHTITRIDTDDEFYSIICEVKY